jgi:hypothetical protein
MRRRHIVRPFGGYETTVPSRPRQAC